MSANVIPLVPLGELPLSRRVTANIRAEMGRYNVQQQDLATILGITPQAVSLKLHDKRAFSLDEIDVIARAFGMEAADLLRAGGRGQGGPPPVLSRAASAHPETTDYGSAQVSESRGDATVVPLTSRERPGRRPITRMSQGRVIDMKAHRAASTCADAS